MMIEMEITLTCPTCRDIACLIPGSCIYSITPVINDRKILKLGDGTKIFGCSFMLDAKENHADKHIKHI